MCDNNSKNGPKSTDSNRKDADEKLCHNAEQVVKRIIEVSESSGITTTVSVNVGKPTNGDNAYDIKWLDEYGKRMFARNSPIILEYHKSEIENVNKSIKVIIDFVKMISIITIVLITLFVLSDKNFGAIITAISSGVIEVVLGALIGLFNSTLKSKKTYFDAERNSAKFDKMLLLLQTIKDQEKRDVIIVDILRKHFNVSNDK